PYTLEGYAAVSYAWLQAKASVAATDLFGTPDSSGSAYYELNANYPIPDTAFTAIAHIGRQELEGSANDSLSYTDWKLGGSYTFSNSVVVGAYYTDNDLANNQDNVTAFVQKTF
ncbi:MAG TPA: TorF family putative porin, partial [Methyloradius sp.]